MSFVNYLTLVLSLYAIYFLFVILLDKMKRPGTNTETVQQVYAIQHENTPVVTPVIYPVSFNERQDVGQEALKTGVKKTEPVISEGYNILYDMGLQTISADSFGIEVSQDNLLDYLNSNK